MFKQQGISLLKTPGAQLILKVKGKLLVNGLRSLRGSGKCFHIETLAASMQEVDIDNKVNHSEMEQSEANKDIAKNTISWKPSPSPKVLPKSNRLNQDLITNFDECQRRTFLWTKQYEGVQALEKFREIFYQWSCVCCKKAKSNCPKHRFYSLQKVWDSCSFNIKENFTFSPFLERLFINFQSSSRNFMPFCILQDLAFALTLTKGYFGQETIRWW